MVEPEKVHEKMFFGCDKPFALSKKPAQQRALYNSATAPAPSAARKGRSKATKRDQKLIELGYKVGQHTLTIAVCSCVSVRVPPLVSTALA